ncbi:MAG: hypothetical protein U5Q16_00790 [Gammaproteobacteria bacterium]|nr:hypothetical protein [Gammaproteobacteria bacterium]
MDLDYYDYNYDDLITRPGGSELIAQDIALRCPQGLNTDPADGPLCGVQPGGDIAGFDPNGGLNDQVIRDDEGNFLRTTPSFTNAQELQTSGLDFRIGYQWATDTLGLFDMAVQASWTNEYEITDTNGVTTDGVGKRNAEYGDRPLVARVESQLVAGLAERLATALTPWCDTSMPYQDDQPVQMADLDGDGEAEPACVGSCLRATNFGISNLLDDRINSFTTVDVQYSYELPAWGIQQEGSRISIGGQNVFNRTPPKLNFDGGFDPFTHDSRGAIWYARYTMQM